MMNKIIKFGVFMVFALTFGLINVNAMSSTLGVSKGTIAPSESFNVNLSVSGLSNGLASADYTVTYDTSKLTYVGITPGQGKPAGDLITSVSSGTISISYMDGGNGTSAMNNGVLATINFKANEGSTTGSSSIGLSGLGYSDKSAATISGTTSGTSVNFYKPSNAAYLTALSVDGEELIPIFSQSTISYSLKDTTKSSIKIDAVGCSKAKVSGTGTKYLSYGVNNLKVVATAEDGKTTKTYTIKVTRVDNRSDENRLSSLSIAGYPIEFNKDLLVYEIDIPLTVKQIEVSAVTLNSKATISGVGNITITDKTTFHSVKVTAENGDVETYKINFINRGENVTDSDVSGLSNLTVNKVPIKLSGNKFLIGVTNNVSKLEIDYTTLKKTDTVTISGNDSLSNGINVVTIVVKGDDDSEVVYTLVVDKDLSGSLISNISSLNSTNVKNSPIIKLDKDSDLVIPKEKLAILKSNGELLTIKVVNEYNGLLYSVVINNEVDASNDLDLSMVFADNLLSTKLPTGIVVSYYVDGIKDNKVYAYDNETDKKLDLESEISNDYVTFITNGTDKYLITGEVFESVVGDTNNKDDSKDSSFDIFSFVVGIGTGLLVSLLVVVLYKNKDKLFKKKDKIISKPSKDAAKSVLTEVIQKQSVVSNTEALDGLTNDVVINKEPINEVKETVNVVDSNIETL